jgi:peptide deformylase
VTVAAHGGHAVDVDIHHPAVDGADGAAGEGHELVDEDEATTEYVTQLEEEFDSQQFDDELKQLTKEMFDIMYASRGVGLAAPQLGINKRLMVFNPEGDPKKWLSELVLCNPEIEEYSTSTALEEEGCLSFPGFTADVMRSQNIQVKWQGLNGKVKRKKLRGWEARIFQHEYDHLDGTLYVDRLGEGERSRVKCHLDDLIRSYEKESLAGPAAL